MSKYPRIGIYQQRFPSPFANLNPFMGYQGFPIIRFIPSQSVPSYSSAPPPSSESARTPYISLSDSKRTNPQPSQPNPENVDSGSAFSNNDENNKANDSNSEENEHDCLSDGEKPAREKRIMGTCAYKKRNVYKSIIRHMFGYMRRHREEIMCLLKDIGYKPQEIEHAFFKVNYYNDMERQKGNPKKSQAIIKKIVKKKCIYTYLLKKTLEYMTKTWGQGKLGKVSSANREIYKEVCTRYYNEALKLLGEAVPQIGP